MSDQQSEFEKFEGLGIGLGKGLNIPESYRESNTVIKINFWFIVAIILVLILIFK